MTNRFIAFAKVIKITGCNNLFISVTLQPDNNTRRTAFLWWALKTTFMFKKYSIIFLTAIAACNAGSLRAQNLPYADARLFHFGFSLGMNLMDFAVTPSLAEINGEVYQARSSALTPGFSVGVIGDLRLSKHLNLRAIPTLHFGQHILTYKPESADPNSEATHRTDVVSLPISIPLYLKFSADREVNYRPYIIGGGGVYFDLGRNKEQPILLKPFDYFVEFGFGCDIYFSFFKLAPELKFAIGFNNMLTPFDERTIPNPDDWIYTQAISKLTTRMLTLTFHFE